MNNAAIGDINVSGFSGALLSTLNVQGTGLDGAVPYVKSASATALEAAAKYDHALWQRP